MTKIKIKKTKRIIVIILLSFLVAINGPTIVGKIIENGNQNIAYAETCQKAPKDDKCTCETGEKKKDDKGNWSCELTTATSTEVDATIRNTVTFILSLQRTLNKLIWPVLIMTGELLSNDILFGSGMEERLREIWIPIRNIVNILFVIALLGIALYNVLGIGDENSSYSIKAILPKIIIGIIAVNFSFLGIKIFLDAINVLTVSIFSLPDQINEQLTIVYDENNVMHQETIQKFCRLYQGKKSNEKVSVEETDSAIARRVADNYKRDYNFEITSTDTYESILAKIPTADPKNPEKKPQEDFKNDFEKAKEGAICSGESLSKNGLAYLKKYDQKNVALAMALNMTNLAYTDNLFHDTNTMDKIFINSLFSLLMYLVYVASFIALFIVLLARLVVMWLSIAVSPVLLLSIAVPVVKEKISGFGKLSEEFIKNAIAPLGIALAMTIGWIMLNALNSLQTIDTTSAIDFASNEGFPVVGLSSIQDLVVALGTVGVVWLGVFTAASATIASGVTDFIKNSLTKAAKFVGTIPIKHAPIIPITIGDKTEPYTGAQVLDALRNITDRVTEPGKLTKRIFGEQYDKNYVKENVNSPEDAYKLLNTMKKQNKTPQQIQEAVSEIIRKDIHKKMPEKLQKHLELIKKETKPAELEKHIKALDNFNQIRDAEPLAKKQGPDLLQKPTGPKTEGKPDLKVIDPAKNYKIGDSNLNTIYNTEEKRNTARIGIDNKFQTAIDAATKGDAGNSKKAVENIAKTNFTDNNNVNHRLSFDDFKGIVGEDNLKKIITTGGFTNEAGLKTFYEQQQTTT